MRMNWRLLLVAGKQIRHFAKTRLTLCDCLKQIWLVWDRSSERFQADTELLWCWVVSDQVSSSNLLWRLFDSAACNVVVILNNPSVLFFIVAWFFSLWKAKWVDIRSQKRLLYFSTEWVRHQKCSWKLVLVKGNKLFKCFFIRFLNLQSSVQVLMVKLQMIFFNS